MIEKQKLPSWIAILILLGFPLVSQANSPKVKDPLILIQIESDSSYHLDSVRIGVENVTFIIQPNFSYSSKSIGNRHAAKWLLPSDSGLLIDLSAVLGRDFSCVFFEPGDSLYVNYKHGRYHFSGNGAPKLNLLSDWNRAKAELKIPKNGDLYHVRSIQEFWDWHKYLNIQQSLLQAQLKKYRSQLSRSAYSYIEANELAQLEYRKLLRFELLVNKASKYDITPDSLDSIFDQEFNTDITAILARYDGWIRTYVYYYSHIRMQVLKSYRYNWDDPFLKSVQRKVLYVQMAKQQYQGYPLQNLLAYLLTTSGLKEHTLKVAYSHEIDSLLNDFYTMNGFETHKVYVKAYEKKISGWISGKGLNTYNFSLKDKNGRLVRRSDFEGKIILVNFWEPGKASIEMNNALEKVYKTYQNDTNLIFVHITSDRYKVLSRAQSNLQGDLRQQFCLYSEDDSTIAPVFKAFNVTTFPSLYLLDENGKSLYNQTNFSDGENRNENDFPDPRNDNGRQLIASIGEQLVMLNDGPYIFRGKDSSQLDYMRSRLRIVQKVKSSELVLFTVCSDQYQKDFTVRLMDSITPTAGVYDRPEKILVLSDIEGNLKAFKKLLINSKVINNNFDWCFGKGHLVFNGDMFDRGKQVTECLWLIYSLEQKAKAAGGAVHFILGNHEVMNLCGDTRYMDKKYKRYMDLTSVLGRKYMGTGSELGNWLRTKNIIEKIGSVLFVHGGISRQLNELNLPIDSINKHVRLYLNNHPPIRSGSHDSLATLINSDLSPFWFRGYYKPTKDLDIAQTIEKTRKQFGISKIITGHTITADTINVHFDGKVINVDTHHARGMSEALLIESDRFFRINANGIKREILPVDLPVANSKYY